MSKENGKTNGQNGKANGTKVIPKDVWKAFAEFWDITEWSALKAADIKKYLGNGKYLFVAIPKDITDKTIGKAWYDQIKEFREKGTGGFGGYSVCFVGQKATLEQVFGKEPINPAQMTKQLHLYINDHRLSSKGSEPKANPKPEEKNGKKTVKVNSVAEMEKAVEKIKNKKGQK
jgi:hypothetical protein